MKDRLKFGSILLPIGSVVLALLIGAVLIISQGKNPLDAYGYLVQGAFGNLGSFGETMVKTTPMIFTGLAVTFAYRCGVFNIGAEGQLMMGALGTTWFALTFRFLPGPLLLPLSMLAGFLSGAVWGAIPGYLKAKRGLNEIINTILLNYVAIQLVSWAIKGPLHEPGPYPQTPGIVQGAWLVKLLPGTRLHAGIIVALISAGLVYYFLFHTAYGYKVRLVGINAQAAQYASVNVPLYFTMALAVSGGLAGLAGAGDILGVQHRLIDGFSSGYGFDGIAVALVAQLQPFGVALAALLFGALRTGANSMQRAVGIPSYIVDIIQGMIIYFVVAATAVLNSEELLSRLRRRYRRAKPELRGAQEQ